MKKLSRKSFLKLVGATSGVAVMSSFTACGESESDSDVVKVAAIVGLGGLGDKSFNDNIVLGLDRSVEEYGIEYQVIEPQEIAEFEINMRELARSGDYSLIVCVGFDQGDALSVVAPEFPEQKFLFLDGELDGLDNVSSVSFKDNEKSFLVASIAGNMTETNKVGIVCGMDWPLFHNFIAGFMTGSAYANPECETLVKYVGSFTDANTAKELTISLYNEGCDIVMAAAGSSGLGVFAAAAEMGKLAIGADVDQIYIDPSCIFISALRALDQVVVNEVGAFISDSFVGGSKKMGLAEGAVNYAHEGSDIETPQEYIDFAEQARQDIIDGKIIVPTTIEEAEAFVEAL